MGGGNGGERIEHPDVCPVRPEHQGVRVVQPRPARKHLVARAQLLRKWRASELNKERVGPMAQLEVGHGLRRESYPPNTF